MTEREYQEAQDRLRRLRGERPVCQARSASPRSKTWVIAGSLLLCVAIALAATSTSNLRMDRFQPPPHSSYTIDP